MAKAARGAARAKAPLTLAADQIKASHALWDHLERDDPAASLTIVR